MNCKYCSNRLPEGAAACPNCGRAVDPLDNTESEIVEAVQIEKSTTKPWLVGVGVGVLVLVLGGVSFALFRNPAVGAAFSDRMPAEAEFELSPTDELHLVLLIKDIKATIRRGVL